MDKVVAAAVDSAIERFMFNETCAECCAAGAHAGGLEVGLWLVRRVFLKTVPWSDWRPGLFVRVDVRWTHAAVNAANEPAYEQRHVGLGTVGHVLHSPDEGASALHVLERELIETCVKALPVRPRQWAVRVLGGGAVDIECPVRLPGVRTGYIAAVERPDVLVDGSRERDRR